MSDTLSKGEFIVLASCETFSSRARRERRASKAAYLSYHANVIVLVVVIILVDQQDEDSSAFSMSAQTLQTSNCAHTHTHIHTHTYRRTSCIVRPLYSATPPVQVPKFGVKFNPLV